MVCINEQRADDLRHHYPNIAFNRFISADLVNRGMLHGVRARILVEDLDYLLRNFIHTNNPIVAVSITEEVEY